jgi:hypothetical protein
MSVSLLVDVVGWLGAFLLLAAYALVSARKLEGDSFRYQVLNILGAIFLITNSFYYGAFPSVTVNVVWIGIAVYTIVQKGVRARE